MQNTLLDRLLKIAPRSLRSAVRGRLRYQPFFERLHRLALVGMNFDEGFLLDISGELELLKRLQAAQTNPDVPFMLFDVGANVGNYSRAALETFGDRVRIHAFEPGPTTAAQFAAALQDDPRVELHRMALSDTAGRAVLISDWQGSPVASLHGQVCQSAEAAVHRDEVETMRLDDFCSQLSIGHIDLLKMDVEGHEFRVLMGASDLLAREAIDGIQFEFAYNNVRSRVFFRDFYDLLSPQYHLFRILKDGLYYVEDPFEHEIFRTSNYYARLKRLSPV